MSIRVMTRVWEHSGHKGSNLLLMLALADNANDDGIAWPGQKYLADKIRMSERTVRRLVGELVESGELEVLEQGGSGPRATTMYRITVRDKADKMTAIENDQGGQDDLPKADTRVRKGGHSYVRRTVIEPSDKPSYTPHTPQGGDVNASDVSDTPGDDPAETTKPKRRKAGELLPEDAERFDRWWAIYPRKEAKATARRAWDRIRPDNDLTDQMITAVSVQAKANDWEQPDRRQFIPLPASWLNAERWNDEVPVAGAGVTVETRPVGSTGRYTPTRDNSREAAVQRAQARATPEWTRERLAEAGLPVTEQQWHEYTTGAADTRWRDVLTGEQMEALNAAFRRLVNLEMTALG